MRSIVDDRTTYRYTTREVKLTGLPRFDRLLEEGKRFPPDQRDLILIAPTWRQWLLGVGADLHRTALGARTRTSAPRSTPRSGRQW